MGWLLLGCLTVGLLVLIRCRAGAIRAPAVVAVAVALIAPVWFASAPGASAITIDERSTLWVVPGAAVLELDGGSRTEDVLAAVRRSGSGRLDLVVVRTGGRSGHTTLDQLRQRFEVANVWAPEGHALGGASDVTGDQSLIIGDLQLVVHVVSNQSGDRLEVEGTSR